MNPKFVTVILTGVAMLVFGCPFGKHHRYSIEITELTIVEPIGDSLNDSDDAVGGVSPSMSLKTTPAVWRDGQLLLVNNDEPSGILYGINNDGAVVGEKGQLSPIGTGYHFISFVDAMNPIPTMALPGSLYSLNESDEFVGLAGIEAVVGSMFDDALLSFNGDGGARAYDINDQAHFVGSTSDGTGTQRAARWQGSAFTRLGSFGGTFSEAYAINNHDIAVGVTTDPPTAKTTEPHQAVYWMGGEIVAFPTLGGVESTAWDINDRGDAVGFSQDESEESRAVLWRNIGDGTPSVIDLNDVTDFGENVDSLILRDAIDINEPGTILCRADRMDEGMTETVYLLLRP